MKNLYALMAAALLSFSSFAAGHTVSISATTMASCYGTCDGSATASVSGGIGPFTYTWSPFGGTGATASSLCAGTYTITVTDDSDMSTAIATVTITQPTAVSVASVTICSGASAILTATGTGGTSYGWSTGDMTSSITVTPFSTTTYTVTGTFGGCVGTATGTVTVNAVPVLTPEADITACAGSVVPMNTFISSLPGSTFTWSNSNTSVGLIGSGGGSTPAFTAGSGSSVVTVTAAHSGCVSSPDYFNITVSPAVSVSLPSSYIICPSTYSAVTLDATPSGGTGSYSYSWSPATGLAAVTVQDAISAPVSTTTYTIMVTDVAGCTGTAATTVTVGGVIYPNLTSENTSACGICDGSTSTAAIGGSPPYTFLWNDGSALSLLSGLCAGEYYVIITDNMGCTGSDTISVYDPNPVQANFTVVPDSTNANNFFFFNSSTGPGLSYIWDFADGATATTASPSHIYPVIGTYNICLYLFSSTCGEDTLCQPHNVDGVLNSCNALFNIGDDTVNADPNAHYVYNLSYGATLSYLWDFGDGSTSTLATPSHIYTGTGPYLLCLTVDNGSGCTDMYCDSLISADSLNRSSGQLQITVFDVPPFQSITTSVEELNSNSVSVFPNPFEETATFVLNRESNEIYSFELMDSMGKKLMQIDGIAEKQFSISKGELQPGIYFYRIASPESIAGIGKLIIKE